MNINRYGLKHVCPLSVKNNLNGIFFFRGIDRPELKMISIVPAAGYSATLVTLLAEFLLFLKTETTTIQFWWQFLFLL